MKHLKIHTYDEDTHQHMCKKLEDSGFKPVTSFIVDFWNGRSLEKIINVYVKNAKQAKQVQEIANWYLSKVEDENG